MKDVVKVLSKLRASKRSGRGATKLKDLHNGSSESHAVRRSIDRLLPGDDITVPYRKKIKMLDELSRWLDNCPFDG